LTHIKQRDIYKYCHGLDEYATVKDKETGEAVNFTNVYLVKRFPGSGTFSQGGDVTVKFNDGKIFVIGTVIGRGEYNGVTYHVVSNHSSFAHQYRPDEDEVIMFCYQSIS
jgi:hypothetical protein